MIRRVAARICACAALVAVSAFGLAGCGNTDPEVPVKTIGDLTDEVHVNLYGRNCYSENWEGMTFFNAASGFEVRFYGTSLKVSALAYGDWDSMFSVFLDGEEDSNAHIVTIAASIREVYRDVVLVNGAEEGEHTVKVLKRTDSYRSATVVQSVTTDGLFLTAPERPSVKIEFYGDSITNGSGVLRQVDYDQNTDRYIDSNAYTAETQNGLQSYAFTAAQLVNAEAQYYGRGGIAMTYSSGRTVLNNPYAAAVDLDPEQYPYDYNSYTPDVVVIYLGTNDYNIGKNNPSLGYSSDGLQVAFMQFIRNVIGLNYSTEIPIILCSGMMVPAADLGGIMRNVKNALPEFPNLFTVEFEVCGSGHPIVAENERAGELLANKIKEILRER